MTAELTIPLGMHALRVDLTARPDGDAFERWAVDAVGDALESVQALVADTGEEPLHLALILDLAEHPDAWTRAAAHAAVEALRGAVHSLTPELGPRARINLLVVPNGADRAAEATLAYIASPGGAYVAGSTFDLRRPA